MKKPEGKAEAGWYDAPEIIGYEQYWDGSKWLSQKRLVGSNEDLKKSPDFIVAISNGFIKVFDYKGTAKRYEFWYFVLFYYLATQIGSVLLASLNLAGLLILLYLSLFACLISVAVRRMHDVGKSGWYILIPIYSLVLYVQPTKTSNAQNVNPQVKQAPAIPGFSQESSEEALARLFSQTDSAKREKSEEFKNCPMCAEQIRFAAKKCRFCQHILST